MVLKKWLKFLLFWLSYANFEENEFATRWKKREGKGEIERERESKERRKEARSIHINTAVYININTAVYINIKLFYTLFLFLKHTKQQFIPR